MSYAPIITVYDKNGNPYSFPFARGAKGDKGDKGDRGTDGTGVTILGSYDSEEALYDAHPTGSPSDSYLVSGDLYVWSATDGIWKNVGTIQGPRGEKGDIGPQGPQGEQGEKGDTYTLTQADKTEIANEVLSNFTDVSEVGM